MNMKLTTLGLAGLFGLTSFVAQPVLADEWNKKTEFQPPLPSCIHDAVGRERVWRRRHNASAACAGGHWPELWLGAALEIQVRGMSEVVLDCNESSIPASSGGHASHRSG